jgi:phosphatidylglycerophosphate synthase
MNNNLLKNSPNIITLIRVVIIFGTLFFLNHNSVNIRIWGFIVLFFAFLLDGIDGFLARKFNPSNNTGPLVDTLGDRITENVILIFFAYKKLIPLFIPIIFISRSFIADFIRFLAFSKGISTFAINKSKMGYCIVASKTSRTLYLLLKFLVFLLGAFIIVYPNREIIFLFQLPSLLIHLTVLLLIVNILRFIWLIYDSREIIKTYS